MRQTVAPQPETFTREARVAVSALRQAMADVLASMDADAGKPQEVSRRFGLDKMLTWRVSRVVCEDDVWEAAAHVPRRPSFKILADALARHGGAPELIARMSSALDEFERVIEVHAGDRETFDILVAGMSSKDADRRRETLRRTGYQAASAAWGVAADVHVAVRFVFPSRTPGMLDLATLCGFAGFRRLRADVPWAVATVHAWSNPSEAEARITTPDPLDPDVPPGAAPLVRRFCSASDTAIQAARESPRAVRYVLEAGPVGNTASADVFLGWVTRGLASARASKPGERGEHGCQVNTPAALLLHDLYIHRSLEFARRPDAALYGALPGGPRFPDPAAMRLPVGSTLADLGTPPDLTTPEAPTYAAMVEHAATCLGIGIGEFHGYRYRVRYAPIPSVSIIRHALLEP